MTLEISPYIFKLISTPKALTFDENIPVRNYRRVFFSDSLFKFFPYGELYYGDSIGLITDHVFFIEGLEFELTFGREDVIDIEGNVIEGGYINNTYFWSENQINKINMADNVSGDNILVLCGVSKRDDHPRSRSWNNDGSTTYKTIDTILKTDILPELNIDATKQFISKCDGTPYICQCADNNRTFVESLSTIAYSSSFQKSPFYTFINSAGEFYFMALEEMMKQPPVKEYQISFSKDIMLDSNYIKDYNIMFGGAPVNLYNYNKRFFKFKADGSYENEYLNIHDAIPICKDDNIAKDYTLIRNTYIPTEYGTGNHYFGIQYSQYGNEYYKGYKNKFYRDSCLNYRLMIMVDFDPKCVAGKTITISIQKGSTNDNQKAVEFTGKWLICESMWHYDYDGKPYTILTVSKPQIALDSSEPANPFINDFHA
jgi:hypothetical protein